MIARLQLRIKVANLWKVGNLKKLPLPAQAEWMQYFESEKVKANAIQQLIDKTDKEIDEIVYQLYGLTEEEIRVVVELD